ncbi:MAG TPA: peptidylprolyl isomerase [Bryobacteraceae bacterium]|nr:peptidylprolyl isomerase [Bryobacteraceae bacterium]
MRTRFLRVCFGLVALGWAAFAQSPLPAKVPNDTVVAKIDGKDVTAGEVYAALLAMPPQFVQMYNQNPKYAIQQLFMMRYLADEGEKLKLGERSPYKEQLAAERANVLAGALLGYQQDHFPVSDEAVQKYYDQHTALYQQAKVRAISIRFKPVADPKASFEARARADMEAALANVQRSEEEARTRANEAAGKLKDGGDFAKLVEEYSDDAASKAKGGDLGIVENTSAHANEIKQAVTKLEVGELSAPVRVSNAFFILRVDEKVTLPKDRVQGLIIEELRKTQIKAWFEEVTRRFDPKVESPEFFTQPAPVPVLQAPAPKIP